MSASAVRHLLQEPKIAPLAARYIPKFRDDFGGDVYFGLLRSIAFQQLSGKAAGTIWARFLQLFPDGYPHAERVLELEEGAIRAVGMSRAKTDYVKNVANYWREEKLLRADWDSWTDQEIIDKLTAIKGVGKWTTEMVLMFVLQRPDLLPLDDLVVKRNVIALFEVDTEALRGRKLNEELTRLAEPWRPYRSYASRLMWEWDGAPL